MKRIILSVFIFLFSLANVPESAAQCAMCKSTVESNQKMEVTNRAEGLNAGILYLMIIPYILFGVIGYLWYQNSTKDKREREKLDAALKRGLAD